MDTSSKIISWTFWEITNTITTKKPLHTIYSINWMMIYNDLLLYIKWLFCLEFLEQFILICTIYFINWFLNVPGTLNPYFHKSLRFSIFNIIICRNIGLGLFYIFQDYHNTYLLPLDNHLVKKHLFATTLYLTFYFFELPC